MEVGVSDFLRELIRERFGPPPLAELHRPLAREIGVPGPATPAATAARIRVLTALDSDGEVA